MRRYTKEQLLYFLKKYYKTNKKTPTAQEINKNKRYPSCSTYAKRFGGWNAALKKAGLKPNVKRRYTKGELVNALKQFFEQQGRVPRTTDLKKNKWLASYTTYRKYFGGWKQVLLEAKLLGKTEIKNLKDFL
ncbi:hypothetical protein JW930_07380 [Candidatus Woesearchaeota archaeon]|nr:hypothetical protein [Candidatus Woesearchaeota archaeon]